ncbi:MAG: hypothetical protein HY882_05785 [Deltaproteobacteria bacterium]|nr:hypothetical protein [Deltaproteobacteria bacterium]
MRTMRSCPFHPPTQETMALAVEECVTPAATIAVMDLACFGGFRPPADDPPKPPPAKELVRRAGWRLRTDPAYVARATSAE